MMTTVPSNSIDVKVSLNKNVSAKKKQITEMLPMRTMKPELSDQKAIVWQVTVTELKRVESIIPQKSLLEYESILISVSDRQASIKIQIPAKVIPAVPWQNMIRDVGVSFRVRLSTDVIPAKKATRIPRQMPKTRVSDDCSTNSVVLSTSFEFCSLQLIAQIVPKQINMPINSSGMIRS